MLIWVKNTKEHHFMTSSGVLNCREANSGVTGSKLDSTTLEKKERSVQQKIIPLTLEIRRQKEVILGDTGSDLPFCSGHFHFLPSRLCNWHSFAAVFLSLSPRRNHLIQSFSWKAAESPAVWFYQEGALSSSSSSDAALFQIHVCSLFIHAAPGKGSCSFSVCSFLHFVSASSWKFQSRVGPASFSTKQEKKSDVKRVVCLKSVLLCGREAEMFRGAEEARPL